MARAQAFGSLDWDVFPSSTPLVCRLVHSFPYTWEQGTGRNEDQDMLLVFVGSLDPGSRSSCVIWVFSNWWGVYTMLITV